MHLIAFRSVLLLRRYILLLREIVQFAREHKSWWIVPVIFVLLIIGALIATTSVIAPFIYPLF